MNKRKRRLFLRCTGAAGGRWRWRRKYQRNVQKDFRRRFWGWLVRTAKHSQRCLYERWANYRFICLIQPYGYRAAL